MKTLGFDTSNYTTSCATLDGDVLKNCSRLLPVKEGELGLRQSEALFQHVKALPLLLETLAAEADLDGIQAVAASSRPRAVEGSYMPCFLEGCAMAKGIASVLGVPCSFFSHQQGHLAAVLYDSGNNELLDGEFLAWHLSGGTTELLHVKPGLECEKIGGTTDISAGQLIDRTGVMLGLPFPAGRKMDAMSRGTSVKPYKVKMNEMYFSLSGMENQVRRRCETDTAEETAAFAIACCVDVVRRATHEAKKRFGDLPVIFAGGVASNSVLRETMTEENAIFSKPQYASDNAAGIAVLAAYGGTVYGRSADL